MTKGICPVCNGTGHMPCPDNQRHYGVMYGWYSYRAEDDTIKCTNCGGQTMYGEATGKVNLREDGTPCKHEYTGQTLGRCYVGYTCKHCGDYYTIDSSD